MKRFIINSKEVRANAVQAVSQIKGEEQLEVVIQRHKKRKTDEQRSFWHVLLSILGEETGYTLGEVKYLVKAAVIGSETVSVGNMTVEVVPSSEKQDRERYSELIEATYQIAAEAGIELPPARFIGDG